MPSMILKLVVYFVIVAMYLKVDLEVDLIL